MSHATAKIICDKCEYTNKAFLIFPITVYLYNDSIEIPFECENGWCYSCNKNVLIENFENTRIEYILNSYRKWKINNPKSNLIEQEFNSWLMKNKTDFISPQRCIFCGSTNIQKIKIPYPEEIDKLINIKFEHPGCGGSLLIHNISLRIIPRFYEKRYYDLNGKFIRSTDEKIHY